jgi:hypothetical protein
MLGQTGGRFILGWKFQDIPGADGRLSEESRPVFPNSQLSRINLGRHPIGCPSASCGNTGSFISLRASPIT